jgi:hypothetical protein
VDIKNSLPRYGKKAICDAIRLPTVARLDLNIISCLSGKDCQRAAVCVCRSFFIVDEEFMADMNYVAAAWIKTMPERAREKTAAGERRKIGTHQGVIAWHCEQGSLDMVRCASRLYWSSPLPNYIYMRAACLSLISTCINVNSLGFGRLICHRMDKGKRNEVSAHELVFHLFRLKCDSFFIDFILHQP